MLGFVGEMRPIIFHLGDPRVSIMRDSANVYC
jgi:hypothetical protein